MGPNFLTQPDQTQDPTDPTRLDPRMFWDGYHFTTRPDPTRPKLKAVL